MKAKITLSFVAFVSVMAFAQNGRHIQNPSTQNPNTVQTVNAITTLTATIPYQGYDETAPYLGQGEYEIFLDNIGGILDKPIILLDGFDPGDARDIPSIYAGMNYGTGQNMADELRGLGYDVIILNFPNYTQPATSTLVDGGVDYIQRNAMVMVELINQINTLKVGNEKNVVIGPSMGGLIARYGLRYMEMNSLDHDTRLYISFDSPHNGANIPIGFQHLFNYMAYGPLGDATVQALVEGMLKSKAAREMLIDQFEGHLQSGSAFEFNNSILLPTGSPNFRTAFQNELNTMGFPQQNIRNVAVANGAGNGTMNGTPGMVVMDHTFNITATQRAIINLNFTPAANQTIQVSRFRAQMNIITWITLYESLANSQAPSYTAGLDAAPGGRYDVSGLASMVGTNPMMAEFFNNLNITYFDFIPTNSSLALTGTQDLYQPVTASSTTPFAAYYVPTVNENHMTFTPGNIAFIVNEILNPTMAVAENVFSGLQVENPVGQTINMQSIEPIANATVSVVDISGKTVFVKERQSIEGVYQIPVSLSSGMYFLNIRNGEGSMTKKLVKN